MKSESLPKAKGLVSVLQRACANCLLVALWSTAISTPGCKADSAAGAAGGQGGGGGTSSEVLPSVEVRDNALRVIVDPYGLNPLSAVVALDLEGLGLGEASLLRLEIDGQRGGKALIVELDPRADEFRRKFELGEFISSEEFGVPVLGLYQDAKNTIRIELSDGKQVLKAQVRVETPRVFPDERVTIHQIDEAAMEAGWTFVSGPERSIARVYDGRGELRWVGPTILRIAPDGNILEGRRKLTWFGRVVKEWPFPDDLGFHHDAMELSNGHLVACATNGRAQVTTAEGSRVQSVADYVVELDEEGGVVEGWDLRQFLDVDRATVSNSGADWAHTNTLYFDEDNSALYLSNRYQGLLKLVGRSAEAGFPDGGKNAVWLMAPHMGWSLAGPEGEGPLDPNDFLLTAVDSLGVPYSTKVQKNLEAPPVERQGFFWPIGQHGIVVTKNEGKKVSLLTFNNQASFLFDGEDSINNGSTFTEWGDLTNDRSVEPYSVVVEYEIDEEKKTVHQVWSFGQERSDLYGSYNSGVTLLPESGNLLITTNGFSQHEPTLPRRPQILEVTRAGETVFHLEIQATGFSAYRVGRIDLYGQ